MLDSRSHLAESLRCEVEALIRKNEGRCTVVVLLDFREQQAMHNTHRDRIRCAYSWLRMYRDADDA